MNIVRILGYKDIYPKPKLFYKQVLAKRIGRKKIMELACLLLTYCRKGHRRPLDEMVAMFFTYKGNVDQQGYDTVMLNIQRLVAQHPGLDLDILSEESLLNMYIWAATTPDIPDEGNGLGEQNSPDLLKLVLLFNESVLSNFDRALNSAKKYPDRVVLRNIFAERFPQTDIVDIDYPKVFYTQLYKLMELLSFLESTPKYKTLYEHFLNDFKVNNKLDFFKAIGGAVVPAISPKRTGINSLVIEDNEQAAENRAFLDKMAHSSAEAEQGPTDYKFLRDMPLQKLPDEYRVIFDLFLLKKLYNGIVFKLSAYVNEHPALLKGGFLGAIRNDFTEGVLVYNVMKSVMAQKQTVAITGNEFKDQKLQREPDYYCRHDKRIILIESKDFFMRGDEKLSYNFDTIMTALSKDGRLKKAALQLATNAVRALKKELPIDTGYDPAVVSVLPVAVLHDSLYECPGLNYWANEWFQEELEKLKQDPANKTVDFSLIKPLTLVDIDTLILYKENFEKGELNLYDMVEDYQQYVSFASASDGRFEKAIEPFTVFAYNYANRKGVTIDPAELLEKAKKMGLQ